MGDSTRIRLGVLTRPHALEGALRCMLDNPVVPIIATPCEVLIGFSEAFAKPWTLERYEAGRGEISCFFQGVNDREKALTLTDQAVFLPRKLLSYEQPYTDPGLVGFEVRDEEGTLLGRVAGMLQTKAHYIWRVDDEGREWMLPAIDEFVLAIDEEAKKISVKLIPGLYSDDLSEDHRHDQEETTNDGEG